MNSSNLRRLDCSANTFQVFVLDLRGVHVYHRCRSGRDLFGPTPQWIHLHMGCRKRWSRLRQILRFHSRLVVLNCMDDIRRRQLPGQGLAILQLQTFSPLGLTQTTANYIVSQLSVWEIDFPGGARNDNVKWRALIWIISEGILVLAIAINYLPPRMYSFVFKFSVGLFFVDFLLCLIWLPIGVSRSYGLRSAKEVFIATCQHFLPIATGTCLMM